jgi:hypothetical protein
MGNFNATKPKLDSNPPSSYKPQGTRENSEQHHQMQTKSEFGGGDKNRISAHKENQITQH